MKFNVSEIRSHFPILSRSVGEAPLVYLDTAASAQTPTAVLEAMDLFYREDYSNIHRGMHLLSEAATEAYEGAREQVASFIGATAGEVVFTRSCTESLNLVAQSWGRSHLKKGDTVLLSILEHHSNIVPWQMLEKEIGIKIVWVPLTIDGHLDLDAAKQLMEKHQPKLLSITGQSNVLGVRVPVEELVSLAQRVGACVCVDAAQLVAHQQVNVQELGCDFLTFSGHKLYGPTGVGVLYAKKELLEEMSPLLGGGAMIHEVTVEGFTPAEPPQRFEAGTMPIAEVVGLGAAVEWMAQFNAIDIEQHEHGLINRAAELLPQVDGLTLLPCPDPTSLLSFTIDGVHPHDLTALLSEQGICMRAGHHCTQPLHDALGVPASTRLSVGIYNTLEEIALLPEAMEKAITILRR